MGRKEPKNPEECHLIQEEDDDDEESVSPCKVFLLAIILVVILTGIGVMILNYRMVVKSPKALRKLTSSNIGHNSSKTPRVDAKVKTSKNSLANEEMCNTFRSSNKSYTGINSSNVSAGIFFVTDDGILSDQDSCSIESALKSLPQTKIYLLELLCGNRPREILKGTNYSELLAKTYNNFLHISIEGLDYFKDSPLRQKWECDNQMSLFGAMVLTAWAYGSPTLLPEVIINRPESLATKSTLVSQFVILNNKRCDDFLYNILESIKIDKNVTYIPHLLTEVLNNFRKEYPSQMVNILDKTHVCDHMNINCVFIIIEDLKKHSASWSPPLAKFCPTVIKYSQENKQKTEDENDRTILPPHGKCR